MPPNEATPPSGDVASENARLSISGDWTAQLTQKVEDVVSLIRDRTVRPVQTGVRYFIFGLVASVVLLLALVLFVVSVLRILDTEVPVFHTRVWASYLVVSGIFWTAGLLLSRMRRPRD